VGAGTHRVMCAGQVWVKLGAGQAQVCSTHMKVTWAKNLLLQRACDTKVESSYANWNALFGQKLCHIFARATYWMATSIL